MNTDLNKRILKVALISDLHCHHSRKFEKDQPARNESYLLSDAPRLPPESHPIQSMLELIEKDEQSQNPLLNSCEFLLCPGDIANRVDQQGFITGWEYVRELGEKLQVQDVIATLGNHDVDSRYVLTDNVFKLAKGLRCRGFPFTGESEISNFWDKGFAVLEKENALFLVINSVHFHTNKDQSAFGKVESDQLGWVKTALADIDKSKILIAMVHHHPIEHERLGNTGDDIIVDGGNLMQLLSDFEFDLVIHGHKHDPWLRYGTGDWNRLPVFSSGSFSVSSKQMITGTKNTFHTLTMEKGGNGRATGRILTWEYLPHQGWRMADSGDEFFPMATGFGYVGNIDDLVDQTKNVLEEGNGAWIGWDEFMSKVPQVANLTPKETISFRNQLLADMIATIPELPKLPKQIGKMHGRKTGES